METKTTHKITKEMTIGDVVNDYPEIIDTLASFGVHCVGCHASPFETLADGFASHGMTEQEIDFAVSTLNKVHEAKLKEGGSSNGHKSHIHSGEKLIITDKTVSKVKELLQKENKSPDYGLRVEVIPGGCSGMTYDMSFDNKQREDDEIIEKDGLKVFVDKSSLQHLHGSRIDFVDSLQGSGFKIDNPNATKTCGCGSSFG